MSVAARVPHQTWIVLALFWLNWEQLLIGRFILLKTS